jgi:diguanylate cyclase (GGDEF)-like protein/PAS domain S-box-containing protein
MWLHEQQAMDFKGWRFSGYLLLVVSLMLFVVTAVYVLEFRISGWPEEGRCVAGYGAVLGFGGLVLVFILSRVSMRRKNSTRGVPHFPYEEVFHKGEILIHVIDLQGRIMYVNQAWKDVMGYADAELMHKNIFSMLDHECQEMCRQRLERLLEHEEDTELFQLTLRTRENKKVVLEGNCSIGYDKDKAVSIRGLFRDISERKAEEQHLLQLAYYDGLTGLPNRHLLPDRLRQAMAAAARYAQYCAVIFLDLDGFKQVNDTLGHAQGDFLLRQAGQRLALALRENDTVSRVGGDEFVIVVTGLRELSHIDKIVQKLQRRLEDPFVLEDNEFNLRASVGIAVYPDDGDTVETLLAHADSAMYRAKEQGKGGYCMFKQE